MVADEHVRLAFLQVLAAGHLHGNQKDPQNEACPPLAGVVSPKMTVADGAPHGYRQARDDGRNNGQGHSHKKLIDTIQIFHWWSQSFNG